MKNENLWIRMSRYVNFENQLLNRYFVFVLIFMLGIFNGQFANAQVNFTASAPEVVVVNQNFNLIYRWENSNGAEFTISSLKDFEIMEEPKVETSLSIINGVKSQYEIHTYLLKSKREGEFIIPGASINVDGSLIKSNDVTVVVTNSKPVSKSKNKKPKRSNKKTEFENQKRLTVKEATVTDK